jgi:hypothetical protein
LGLENSESQRLLYPELEISNTNYVVLSSRSSNRSTTIVTTAITAAEGGASEVAEKNGGTGTRIKWVFRFHTSVKKLQLQDLSLFFFFFLSLSLSSLISELSKATILF